MYYFAVNIPITNEQLSVSGSKDDNSSASVALITVFTIFAVAIMIIIGIIVVLVRKKRTMKSFEV